MDINHYPTPAQTTVFIGGYHIDDAYGVHFEVQHPRVPLYSYNQSEFSQVADGKILVTGTLMINFRYPGYLAEAIKNYHRTKATAGTIDRIINKVGNRFGVPESNIAERASSPHLIPYQKMNRDQLKVTLQALRATDDPNARLQILALSLSNGNFQEVSKLARAAVGDHIPEGPIENPVLAPSRGGNFEIQVAYGDASGPMKVDILKDCYITGMSKHITSSAHGARGSVSGAAIFESYPFIARRLDQWVVDPHEGTVKEYGRTPKAFSSSVPLKTVSDYLS